AQAPHASARLLDCECRFGYVPSCRLCKAKRTRRVAAVFGAAGAHRPVLCGMSQRQSADGQSLIEQCRFERSLTESGTMGKSCAEGSCQIHAAGGTTKADRKRI